MRQAVISHDEETLAAWGFADFQDVGVREIKLLSCDRSGGVVRIHVEEEVDEQRLDENETVEWWEQVRSDNSEYVYIIEASGPGDTDDDWLVRTEEIEVNDGEYTFKYYGSSERISNMVSEMKSRGIKVNLEKIQSYHVRDSPLDALTDRQLEVLDVASRLGYYDVPRQSSTMEIADELGIDDSTVCEHLQRAERNVIVPLMGHNTSASGA